MLDLGGRTIEAFSLEIDTASRIVNGTVKDEKSDWRHEYNREKDAARFVVKNVGITTESCF